MNPELVFPSEKYKESFLEALAEETNETSRLEGPKERGDLARSDFSAFLKLLEDERNGINLKEERVPQTAYWLVEGDKFIGRVSIRHFLNEKLKNVGGHIGYSIRPTEREKGYGSLILKLVLPKAKGMGLDKVMVTCSKDNIASKKIIEKNQGMLDSEGIGDKGEPLLRFWIENK